MRIHPSVMSVTLLCLSASVGVADTHQGLAHRVMISQMHVARALVRRLASEHPGANDAVSPAGLMQVLNVLDLGGDHVLRAAIRQAVFTDPNLPSEGELRSLLNAPDRATSGSDVASETRVFLGSSRFGIPEALSRLEGVKTIIEPDDPEGRRNVAAETARWTETVARNAFPAAPMIDAGAAAWIVNVSHFSANWTFSFETVEPRPFHVDQHRTVPVMTMQSSALPLNVKQDAQFVAVKIPLAAPGTSLVVLTTTTDPTDEATLERRFDWLNGEGFTVNKRVALSLPRFAWEGQVEMLSPLKALHLDLSRPISFFKRPPVTLARFDQFAALCVDERGVEVRSMTTSGYLTSQWIEKDVVPITVDKPFLFTILNEETGFVEAAGFVTHLGENASSANGPDEPRCSSGRHARPVSP